MYGDDRTTVVLCVKTTMEEENGLKLPTTTTPTLINSLYHGSCGEEEPEIGQYAMYGKIKEHDSTFLIWKLGRINFIQLKQLADDIETIQG